MNVQETIENKITEALSPSYLTVMNESYMHSVPPGSESHFKLVVVTDPFTVFLVSGVIRQSTEFLRMSSLDLCMH